MSPLTPETQRPKSSAKGEFTGGLKGLRVLLSLGSFDSRKEKGGFLTIREPWKLREAISSMTSSEFLTMGTNSPVGEQSLELIIFLKRCQAECSFSLSRFTPIQTSEGLLELLIL